MPSSVTWKNLKRAIFLVVGLFVVLHCLAVLLYVARQATKGFYVFEGRRVASVDQGSSASLAGIEPGDLLVSIDNVPIRSAVDVIRVSTGLEGRIGRQVAVVVERADAPTRTCWITVERASFPVRLLLWFIVASVGIGASFAFYLRRTEDRPTGLFFLMCVVYCGFFMDAFAWNVIIGKPSIVGAAPIFGALMAPVTLHFFLIYPETSPAVRRFRWLTAALYAPSAVYLGVMMWCTWELTGRRYDPATASRWVDWMSAASVAQIALTLVYYGLSLASLGYGQRTTIHTEVRNQIKWVWWGLSTAVLPILIMGWLLAAEGPAPHVFGGLQFWAMLATSGVLVATGLSLLKYRLMYIDAILGRSLGYVVMTMMMMALYLAAVGVASLILTQVTGEVGRIPFLVSVLIIAALFRPVNDWVQREVDKRFYRDRYELQQAVYETSQAIVGTLDLDRVLERLMDTVMNSLHVKRGAIVLGDPEDRRFRPAVSRGYVDPATVLTLEPDNALTTEIERLRAPVTSHELRERALEDESAAGLLALMDRMHAEVAVPVLREGKVLGVFILGRKRSRQLYSSVDLRLLMTLANHAAIAIQNAGTYRRMERLNAELRANLAKIDEQRREILGLQTQILGENVYLKQEIEEKYNFQDIVGNSRAIQDVLDTVKKVAPSPSAVLVRGESGTGKELVARAIHYNSPRRDKPFVRMNCAVFTEGLLESELFGHEKGSFTGAVADRPGRFEIADGGTIFLDEIGDISPRTQVKLLRVLQEKEFERVGSNRTRKVDVRVIAATNRNLESLMKQGLFREDLFWRLNVITIEMPPLRDRREDLSALSIHFLRRYARAAGKPVSGIEPDVIELFKRYRWPGNIRELENLIERAVVLSDGPTLTVGDFPIELREGIERGQSQTAGQSPSKSDGLVDEIGSLERERIRAALSECGGNQSHAAKKLGLARTTLISKMRKYGIE